MSDLLNAFRARLEEAGLVPGEIIADGVLHRCATVEKPRSVNAAYKAHLDEPPSLWWMDWATEQEGTWTAKGKHTPSPAERQALQARIKADRRARQEEEAKRHAEARDKAQSFLADAPDCTTHPYLERKGVKPCPGLKLLDDGRLVVPVLSPEDGKAMSLQTIEAEGSKRFLPGGRIRGGFFLIKGTEGPLYICEGLATGLSIHEATGQTTLCAFNAVNLEHVAAHARKTYPDRELVLCADDDRATKDNPGLSKATAAAKVVGAFLAVPGFKEPAGRTDFNDLHQAEGLDVVRVQLVAAAKPVVEAVQVTETTDDEWAPEATKWPTLSLAAMPGFIGDFIKLATRNSEADPAAVLATFLTRFGVELISPHVLIGDTMHKARLFTAICGASSKARKGTSAAPVKKLFTFSESSGHIPAQFSPGPLSTGEGLVYAVRDELKEWKVDKQTPEGTWVVTDPGVSDKRLFVMDEELAAALHSTNRQGNTLSTAMRCFWDNGSLAPLTKSNRTRTTGAHIALVTHITIAELTSLLDAVQSLNGFANRFLWVYAKRRGLVPFPEPMPETELDAMRRELLARLNEGKRTGRVMMDATARELWEHVYSGLSQEHPGLAGCVINRGEVQVMRLALIYTLLAGRNAITSEHLAAALAFWQYCHESAMMIFGGREADPMAGKVLDVLQGGPKSLTEIHNALGNHDTKRVRGILDELSKSGRVQFATERTGGRSKTVFSLCEKRELSELSPPTFPLSDLNSLNSLNSQGEGVKTEIEQTPPMPQTFPDRVTI